MAFLHCHNCGWSQDDFWSETYGPIWSDSFTHLVEGLLKYVLSGERAPREMDDYFLHEENIPHTHEGTPSGQGSYDYKDLVVNELKRRARQIDNMVFPTEKDWQSSDKRCPHCGSTQMDID
jgi:hypothetical protein